MYSLILKQYKAIMIFIERSGLWFPSLWQR